MFWTIVCLLIALWFFGFIAHMIGGLIHILLVVAAIIIIVKLVRKIF